MIPENTGFDVADTKTQPVISTESAYGKPPSRSIMGWDFNSVYQEIAMC